MKHLMEKLIITHLNNPNAIDHFFTQRKITKHVDYVDTKDMKEKIKLMSS